jgi:hypothetical protein
MQTTPVPIVWHCRFPQQIVTDLVSFSNLSGSITNSDLELAGGILHDEAAAQCYDVRERTIKAGTVLTTSPPCIGTAKARSPHCP